MPLFASSLDAVLAAIKEIPADEDADLRVFQSKQTEVSNLSLAPDRI